MLTQLRKRNTLLGVLAIFIAIGIFFAGINGLINIDNVSSTPLDSIKKVIIDPGHGGFDPGAIGINKANEKDINLAISLYLKDILVVNGFEVIMTRDTDISVNKKDYNTIMQLKTSDLKARLRLFDDNKDAIVLSIHQNKYPSQESNGAQMFYGRKNKASETLAHSIQQAFVTQLQPENKREIKRSTSAVYILHNATNPIVLVECGFISNPKNARELVDIDYQKKVAFTIFTGIVNADEKPFTATNELEK